MPGNQFVHSLKLWVGAILLLFLASGPTLSQPQREPGGGAGREAAVSEPTGPRGAVRDRLVHQGAEVELLIDPSPRREIMEGEFAMIEFKVRDAATGTPLPALRPSVWIDLQKELKGEKGAGSLSCKDKIGLYMQGTLGYRPDIDLNSYFILSLNNDASIAVTNPITSFAGITQLHAMAYLKRPGEDWVLSQDQKRLFVTMPRANQVAVVNTETFKLIKEIPAGTNPFRIAIQPDGKYLWIGNNGPEKDSSGVTVIDSEHLNIVASIRTGLGHHEIAFSEDSLFAFVTNKSDGTLSIIDIQRLKKLTDLPVGMEPASMAYSPLAKSVYVANEGDGTVVGVDGARREVVGRIQFSPGLKALRFSPGGRLGLVANSKENCVDVFDVSTQQKIHTIEVGKEPDQISFSRAYAYIRSKGAPEVTLIQLSGLERKGNVPVARIPMGQNIPASSPYHSVADAIVPTPEEGHVLIANPADRMVYYYMEGMSVPMGSFRSYGRYAQKAVLVLDRSIRETGPGTYTFRIRIPASGTYQVAFLLDSPRILHCFEFSAKTNPALAKKEKVGPQIEFLIEEKIAVAGKKFKLRFKLIDPSKEEPLPGMNDVLVQAILAPGLWSEQYAAVHRGESVYEVDFTAPRGGIYYITFACPSLKIGFSHFPYLVLQARESE